MSDAAFADWETRVAAVWKIADTLTPQELVRTVDALASWSIVRTSSCGVSVSAIFQTAATRVSQSVKAGSLTSPPAACGGSRRGSPGADWSRGSGRPARGR